MNIIFDNKKLQKVFNKQKELERKYGSEFAKGIRKRMDDLKAAKKLEDMRHLPGRIEELAGDLQGKLSIRVSGNYRLIFAPADEPVPLKSDSGLNWNEVTIIRIIGVEDYHGK